MPVNDYNTDPDLNTTISGINIAEGCAPSGINNAIRQLMADVKAEKEERDAAQEERDAAQDEAIISARDKSVTAIAIDGLDLVLTYGDGSEERKELPAGKSVGDLWMGIDPESKPAGVQLYSGQLLSRAAYEAHSALVFGGARTVLTEEEWQAQVSANGFCPFYSSGDGSTTYRFPLVKGVHPKFVSALAEAGQYVEAGAPEISGHFQPAGFLTGYTDGAFSKWGESGEGLRGDESGGCKSYIGMDFFASRSSPVYRDDCDTIQPPALTHLIGEYVMGSVATLGEADAESLLAGQTLLDSKVGALESGSGFNAAGKAKIVGWIHPDYTAPVTISALPYTAPADGYIVGQATATGATIGYLYINDIQVGQESGDHIDIQMFVAAGDIVTGKNINNRGLTFLPLKG